MPHIKYNDGRPSKPVMMREIRSLIGSTHTSRKYFTSPEMTRITTLIEAEPGENGRVLFENVPNWTYQSYPHNAPSSTNCLLLLTKLKEALRVKDEHSLPALLVRDRSPILESVSTLSLIKAVLSSLPEETADKVRSINVDSVDNTLSVKLVFN